MALEKSNEIKIIKSTILECLSISKEYTSRLFFFLYHSDHNKGSRVHMFSLSISFHFKTYTYFLVLFCVSDSYQLCFFKTIQTVKYVVTLSREKKKARVSPIERSFPYFFFNVPQYPFIIITLRINSDE
jgi:hypothetical protein